MDSFLSVFSLNLFYKDKEMNSTNAKSYAGDIIIEDGGFNIFIRRHLVGAYSQDGKFELRLPSKRDVFKLFEDDKVYRIGNSDIRFFCFADYFNYSGELLCLIRISKTEAKFPIDILRKKLKENRKRTVLQEGEGSLAVHQDGIIKDQHKRLWYNFR